jgi:hypothetical protein
LGLLFIGDEHWPYLARVGLALFHEAGLCGAGELLPSALSALSSQHFLMELVRAAPASGLPSLLTAFVTHELWANTDPIPKSETRIAVAMIRAILLPP